MAKKRPKPSADGPEPRPTDPEAKRPPKPPAGDDLSLPDRRALEGFMQELLGELGPPKGTTPRDEAQQIMYLAFETPDPKGRIKLAKQALKVSPDCTDAYVLLAEHAKSRKEALDLYQKGVEAGARALGPDRFRAEAGHFWLLFETRPYMRARLGLAEVLWTSGRRDEAVGHLQEMLRLNPNDNQGVRYLLAGWLLSMDRDDELGRLLAQFKEEGSANWAYMRALLAFRKGGDTAEARRRLKAARKINAHVPAYLCGQLPMPRAQPEYYSPGDENEAILYAATALAGWKTTPGALAWVKESEDGPKPPRRRAARQGKGPTAAVQKRLRALPQEFDVWQADFRQLDHWVEVEGESVRPWMVLVASRSQGQILGNAMLTEAPSAALLWDTLADSMTGPMTGTPHRPTALHVRADARWDELAPLFEALAIDRETRPKLDQLDYVFEQLTEDLAGDTPPGLLEMPGVRPEQVAGFYQAAAQFYRRSPWRAVGYEAAIKVECPKFESGPWYAVIMGQSGLTFGVALYDDLKLLKRLWKGELSDEQSARLTVALTVTFGEETEIPVADLDAGRANGWTVAGPNAYPAIFRKERGLTMRPPLAWELELMEGCLRVLPDFVASQPPDVPTIRSFEVPAASCTLPLTLSWIDD